MTARSSWSLHASFERENGWPQRIKLATDLAKPETGNTLYILDEPTTGLHFEDIRVLIGVLNRLVDKVNSLIVIEHNLDVIRSADWLVDLGPEEDVNPACGSRFKISAEFGPLYGLLM